jgi:hypothetical protein
MKDIRNILLLVVSVCLVGTWVYHIYDKSQYSIQRTDDTGVDPLEVSQQNDSLRMAYNLLLDKLDLARNEAADTAIQTPALINENLQIDSLRNEINYILAINDITKEDLRKAEAKIKDLQKRIQTSSTVKSNPVTETRIAGVSQTNPAPLTVSTKKGTESAPTLIATAISFRALEGNGQTNATSDVVEQFSISCSLLNSSTSFNETDVFVVVTDPSGNVVQDDPWQSGMFLTESGSRVPYTRKSKLSHNKGETNRLALTLKLPAYEKGAYGLQLYHNAVRIGRANLRLN